MANRQLTLQPADFQNFQWKLWLIALFLLLAHGLAMFSKYSMGHDMLFGIVPLFDFYEEHNVPTYFSSFNLLVTAVILFFIARLDKLRGMKHRRAWQTLCFGFLFMSLDEFADLRMVLSQAVKGLSGGASMDAIPMLTVAWTIPVFVIVVMLAIYFIPFLLSLQKIYLINFALAGACFVIAAIGFETVQGNHMVTTNGVRDFKFMLLVTVEETLEIFSILYFQYFLLRYLREHYKDTMIKVQY